MNIKAFLFFNLIFSTAMGVLAAPPPVVGDHVVYKVSSGNVDSKMESTITAYDIEKKIFTRQNVVTISGKSPEVSFEYIDEKQVEANAFDAIVADATVRGATAVENIDGKKIITYTMYGEGGQTNSNSFAVYANVPFFW